VPRGRPCAQGPAPPPPGKHIAAAHTRQERRTRLTCSECVACTGRGRPPAWSGGRVRASRARRSALFLSFFAASRRRAPPRKHHATKRPTARTPRRPCPLPCQGRRCLGVCTDRWAKCAEGGGQSLPAPPLSLSHTHTLTRNESGSSGRALTASLTAASTLAASSVFSMYSETDMVMWWGVRRWVVGVAMKGRRRRSAGLVNNICEGERNERTMRGRGGRAADGKAPTLCVAPECVRRASVPPPRAAPRTRALLLSPTHCGRPVGGLPPAAH
jgi:hypothetical protein